MYNETASRSGRLRRTVSIVVLTMLLAACGDTPLEGMGDRTGEWIGPVVGEISLFPSSRTP